MKRKKKLKSVWRKASARLKEKFKSGEIQREFEREAKGASSLGIRTGKFAVRKAKEQEFRWL